MCMICCAQQPGASFSKRQWKLGAPTCASCAFVAPEPDPPKSPARKARACAGGCGAQLTAEHFTKRQWKRAEPRCTRCAASPAARPARGARTGPFGAPLIGADADGGDGDAPASWPFPVDALDQCETPLAAYEHIAPLLRLLAGALGTTPAALRIYDPYYCAGAAKRHLASLGFARVHHECVDFYAAIADKSTPDFDVLVTNPPWGGDHVERCLRFCRASGRPWVVLLPNFVYLNTERDHFSKVMRLTFMPGGAPAEPICIVPRAQYRYAERFLKSARDVRTRHFALWCVDLCAAAPVVLTAAFWARQRPAQPPTGGARAEALAAWRAGVDIVRSIRHLPYHALDARDPRKRTLTAARRKAEARAEDDGVRKRRRGDGPDAGELAP